MKFFHTRLFLLKNDKGFTVLEVMLAAAAFVVFAGAMIIVVLQSFDANRLASEETTATQYASEGLEAVRSIRNQAFSNLVATTSAGVATVSSSVGTVTQDATVSNGVISATSLSKNITTGSNTNRLLVVGISTGVNGSTVTGVTYGSSLTPLTKLTTQNCSSTCRNEIWYLLNPASGTNQITVTVSTADQISFGAVTYYNVNQSNPFGTAAYATGTGTSPTVTVPGSTAGTLLMDSSTSEGLGACPSANAGQTQQWSVCTSVNSGGSSQSGSASSVGFTWTLSQSQPWSEIAVPINGTSGGNVWAFSGTSNTFDKYTRVITVSSVQTDTNGNIVTSGGTTNSNIMKVTSTVSWNVNSARSDSVVLTTYLANYK